MATFMISVLTLIFFILLSACVMNLFSWSQPLGQAALKAKNAVKLSFFVSLLPLSVHLFMGGNAITTCWTLGNLWGFDLNLSFVIDFYSLMFMSVAFYVAWAIFEFAIWYMRSEPHLDLFMGFLLTFLAAMIILVTANNLMQLFMGWEGVGIMSFLLISWWNGRTNANTSALQAIIYNRIGDIGLVLALAWMASKMNSWEIDVLYSNTQNLNLTFPLLGFILAAMGKSAQFGLHPWLPYAMEGPTPVSALLHSSTMVVAGIFLLLRLSPMLENNPTASTICLCLGAITALFAATCALTQNDLKKIIAFSTSSQLGLMMVTIGLNQPQLAFLHLCMHAFFKALMFISAGSLIHSTMYEQDIRKMGSMFKLMPMTSSCLTIGTLALTGMPFLSGFYSKDPIIEALSTSYLNMGALALTLIATIFTAAYSFRMIYYILLNNPRTSVIIKINENEPTLINPLKRLAYGSIIAGSLIITYILPYKTPVLLMSPSVKLAALFLTLIGIFLSVELASHTTKQQKIFPLKTFHHFSNMLGYFPLLIHRIFPKMSLRLGQKIASQMLDQTWIEKTNPKAISTLNQIFILMTDATQKGELKTFFSSFLIMIIMAISMCYFFN